MGSEMCISDRKTAHSLIVAQGQGPLIEKLISCENFSSLHQLLRVTAFVLKFVRLLCLKVKKSNESAPIEGVTSTEPGSIGSKMLNLSYKTTSFLCGGTS